MENRQISLIIKILGIIGTIFCLVAIFVPWGAGAYPWGFSLGNLTTVFYIDFFTSGLGENIFFGIAMILIFVFAIICTLLGFLGFREIDTKGTKKYFKVAILATVAFVLYIIATSIGINWGIGITVGVGYGIGFVMILNAMILFYIIFAIGKVFNFVPGAAPTMYQQPAYQQPPTQQPQMMYTTQQPPAQQPTPPPQPQAPPTTPPAAQPPPPAKTTPSKTKAATPKFCPECGAQLLPKAKFCPSCGKQL